MTLKAIVLASTATLTLCTHAGAAVFVRPEVKQSVVFIYGEENDGSYGAGTGFFVGVQNQQRFFVYLVTAQHCLQQRKTGPYYPRVSVRVNLKTGESRYERAPLVEAGLGKNVFTHDDPAVDLAVVPVNIDIWNHEAKVLGMDFFPDESAFADLGIGEG